MPEERTVLLRRDDTSSGYPLGWKYAPQSPDVNLQIPSASQTEVMAIKKICRSPATKKLLIGLPPRSNISRVRIMREEPPSPDMTAEKMIERLAKKLGVNKDKWVLLVFSDNNAPYQLSKEDKINRFLTSETERLYFYPKAMIK